MRSARVTHQLSRWGALLLAALGALLSSLAATPARAGALFTAMNLPEAPEMGRLTPNGAVFGGAGSAFLMRWDGQARIIGGGIDGTFVAGISDDGRFVAATEFWDWPNPNRALRYDESVHGRTSLNRPGGCGSSASESLSARAASASGAVIVGDRRCLSDSGFGPFQAFWWDESRGLQLVPFLPGATESYAVAVSRGGSTLVGTSSAPGNLQVFGWSPDHGFRFVIDSWEGGLRVTNDADEILGWSAGHDFLIREVSGGVVFLDGLPQGYTSRSLGPVNGEASAFAGTATYGSQTRAFRWTVFGGFQLLGDPFGGSGSALPTAMSERGDRIGGYAWLDAERVAFLWDPIHGMRSVLEAFEGAVPDGWTLESVLEISPDGRFIAGNGVNPSGTGDGWLIALSDADGDGVPDDIDDCPYAANPGQEDAGGLALGSPPDGIGDACQCGDVDGDGRVTVTDAVLIARSLLEPPAAAPTHPERCDVGGPTGCSVADALIVRRALLAPPTATIGQVCAPATP